MVDLQEPWLPVKWMASRVGWESGEKGVNIGLMTILCCGFVWVTPPFFLMCYLFLYIIWSLQLRLCLGIRKGLGYLRHHIAEKKPSWQPACPGGNTGSVSEKKKKMESLWWYCCVPALLSELIHTSWIISPALPRSWCRACWVRFCEVLFISLRADQVEEIPVSAEALWEYGNTDMKQQWGFCLVPRGV